MTGSNENKESITSNLGSFAQKCLFSILSMGPISDHIAFIMDGNRRYSKKCNFGEGTGHKLGFTALLSMLRYCYELNVKDVSKYAFSIDNFKRSPEEVVSLMEIMQEKVEVLLKEESLVSHYGVRVNFIGNLKLLDKPVRLATEKAMAATGSNSKVILSICVAYSSTNGIVNAVQQSCEEKWDELNILDSCGAPNGLIDYASYQDKKERNFVGLGDIERHMYMKIALVLMFWSGHLVKAA